MSKYYNLHLKDNLQIYKKQLTSCDFNDFHDELNFFYDRIQSEPILKEIINNIIIKYPINNMTLNNWLRELSYNNVKYKDREHKLSYLIHTLEHYYKSEYTPTWDDSFGTQPLECNLNFLNRIIYPIINYVDESLDNISYILYILEKYKLRTEWFTKDSLRDKYKNTLNRQYEQVLEDDIRLYLFDQGINYPFSTPKSASGRADVISLVDTEDPLVMEIKIYDSEKGYKKDRIISGFTQIVKYANDYHKNIGYLVVFNLDQVEIEIENIEPDNKLPNRIIFNGKTYYIIIVNLNYDATASNLKKLNKVTISYDELTS
ncbi:hypothetical protein CLV62_10312 [Dysgonomonas alginatilytica]|uniref:Uncharacterized protein n=1 Tax=Dysgonomonas alginatilytica TaxID=1605892 RepID=A0A2V3PRL7_9BACT|nr:hypothetical protein [Dysgonomonas alginatilytica]PXV67339.1 hypothetical protein CLV62_10312 [Dysgonomonas alginatilytica]